jgi:regulator of replication initiation timing
MDKVIEKLIDIENRAQSVVKDAKKLRDNIDELVEESAVQMAEDIEAKRKAKEQTIIRIEADAADQRIEEIKRRIGQAESRMQRAYEQNIDSWVERIFKDVMKV